MKFTNVLYIEPIRTRFLQARLWRKFEGHVEVASPEQWDVLRANFEWVLLDFHLGAETALIGFQRSEHASRSTDTLVVESGSPASPLGR